MNIKKLLFSKKGSYTVEACLIVSVVLFVLFALVFALLFLSQKAMLIAAAEQSAQEGAEIWTVDSLNRSLYYRITDLNSADSKTFDISKDLNKEIGEIIREYKNSEGTGKKIAWIKYEAYRKLDKCLLKPETTRVDIEYKNYFITGRIKVAINQEIAVPFGFIKALFGGKETMILNAAATANVVEPAEYIRNIDLAVEYGKRIKEGIDPEEIFGRVKGEAGKE